MPTKPVTFKTGSFDSEERIFALPETNLSVEFTFSEIL